MSVSIVVPAPVNRTTAMPRVADPNGLPKTFFAKNTLLRPSPDAFVPVAFMTVPNRTRTAFSAVLFHWVVASAATLFQLVRPSKSRPDPGPN